MTFALIFALVVVNVAFVVHLERKDKRIDSQVDRLLQRIQAPEQAVIEHSQHSTVDGPLYTNEWSDEQERLEALLREEG